MGAGVMLHAAAAALSAPPPAGTIPPPQAAPAPAPPSLEADAQKLLQVVVAAVDTGWQRVGLAMDEFFKLPPEPPPTEEPPAPPPATTAAPAAPPPTTAATPAPAPPPAQTAKATSPAVTPLPSSPPAPPAASQAPAPAPQPVVAAATPPAQPPAIAAAAPTPAASPKPAPAVASVPPSLISSLPVQPAAPTATQVVVNPAKTATNALSGTNALKYLVAKYTPSTTSAGKRTARSARVSLDVHRVLKRKYLPDATDNPALGWLSRSHYRETTTLHITVENLSPQLLTNVVVQWGVVKKNVARDSTARPVVFGTNETVTLKPLDVKNIETAPVEVEGRIDQSTGRGSGDIIRGHAVQVLVGTNIIAEEISPPTLKFSFKELQPVPKPLPPIQQ